jgi:hypothetical protein
MQIIVGDFDGFDGRMIHFALVLHEVMFYVSALFGYRE